MKTQKLKQEKYQKPKEDRKEDRLGKKKVLLVDDHPLFREGLAQFVNRERDLAVCGESENATKALQIIRDTKPDLVVVDISLEGPNGIDLVKSIKAEFEKLPVLVLSMHDESLYAERVLRAGARGYVMKTGATDKVMTAMRRVLNGQIYLSEAMTEKMLEKQLSRLPPKLSFL